MLSRYSNVRETLSTRSYSPSDYDDFACLKPPFMLWLAVVYLSRAITLPLAVALGRYAGVSEEAIAYCRDLWSAESLVPSLLAAAVFYALFRRVPTASLQVRWIWARGSLLLGGAAAIDVAIAVFSIARIGQLNDQVIVSLATIAIDLYFLSYILLARRVRDAFLEFPPPELAEHRQ